MRHLDNFLHPALLSYADYFYQFYAHLDWCEIRQAIDQMRSAVIQVGFVNSMSQPSLCRLIGTA